MATMLNILTIDLEELHHAEYVRAKSFERKDDNSKNDLERTLTLLRKHNVQATFFVVGELVEKHPELLSSIREDDHEVAFHAFYHEPMWQKSAETFRLEIDKFNKITGEPSLGFRAPSFSVDERTIWVLDVLEEAGFKYDSSIFPARTPLYGVTNAPLKPYKPSHEKVNVEDNDAELWEFPLHVHKLAFLRFPMAGGFYLRFLPTWLMARSVGKANDDGRPAVIYAHTWELNPETPKLNLGLYRSFVTFHNLKKTVSRLDRLLSKFKFSSVENYMNKVGLL